MSQADMPQGMSSARRRARAARAGMLAESNGKNASLTKEDWLNAALAVLNEGGVNAVKVLPLSKRLGVTRGSFYWHFEDRDELLQEVLKHWDEELTGTVIAHAQALDVTPRERLEDVLTNVLFNRRNIYDTAIAAWGMFDEEAASVYNRVIRKRLRFLRTLLMETGLGRKDAEFRARLVLGFALSEVGDRGRRSRAEHLEDVKRCCDLVLGPQ